MFSKNSTGNNLQCLQAVRNAFVFHCNIDQLIYFLYAILYVTSTLHYVYFSIFIDTHTIIPLLAIITESQTSILIVKKGPQLSSSILYRGVDKSLARPGRKQARKHVRDARDFNNIETRAVIKFFFPCKARRQTKFTPF